MAEVTRHIADDVLDVYRLLAGAKLDKGADLNSSDRLALDLHSARARIAELEKVVDAAAALNARIAAEMTAAAGDNRTRPDVFCWPEAERLTEALGNAEEKQNG
jgi:hypothetical protein